MFRSQVHLTLTLLTLATACAWPAGRALAGQASGQAEPDVLVFTNGEQLIGRLERSIGGSVTFKSDMVGEVTVDWSKIKELRTSGEFAAVEKGPNRRRRQHSSNVIAGSISMSEQEVTIDPGNGRAPRAIPVARVARLIDERTFENSVLRDPGPLEEWKGSITAGASLVQATQQNRTFTGAVSLVRTIPGTAWLDPRNRTSLDFNGANGMLTQRGSGRLKTEIYHLAAEHDKYFTRNVYAFGQSAFDHNFSQGLDLQQNFGGGIGWTVSSSDEGTLDLKGSVSYLNQQFEDASQNQNLIGSTLSEAFSRKLASGISFSQQVSITPTWNNLNAYAAAASATLTLPVYKRISFSIGALDTFLNNPPPGFRKNSFQLSTGLTYTLP